MDRRHAQRTGRHGGNDKRGAEHQLLSFCLYSLRLLLGNEKFAGSNQVLRFLDPTIACEGKSVEKAITGLCGRTIAEVVIVRGAIY